MGHRKWSAPRRGSLAYLPRGRAAQWTPRIRYWPDYDGAPRLLGFAGFKAGTTHVTITDNRQGSLTFGKEVALPVTVVETPPLIVVGLRFYEKHNGALRTIGEVWAQEPNRDLGRTIKIPAKFDTDGSWEKIEKSKDRIVEIRAITASQPRLAKTGQKKPDLLEVKIAGGSVDQILAYSKGLIGKDIKVSEVFKAGGQVDVIGVTKGKGIQGPVKRWGIKKLKHKSRKTVRGVGSIGPWHPHFVMYSVPRAGQMGFHQRTEYNKQILRIGEAENGGEASVRGGYPRYGPIKTDYAVIRGTLPGPARRMVAIRIPARGFIEGEPPKIEFFNLDSKQGAGP